MINLEVSKAKNAKLPQQSSPESTTMTIFTQDALCLQDGDYQIPTGIAVTIPTGYVGEITGIPLRDFKLTHTVVPYYLDKGYQHINILIKVQKNGSLVVPKHYPIARLYIRESVKFQLYRGEMSVEQ